MNEWMALKKQRGKRKRQRYTVRKSAEKGQNEAYKWNQNQTDMDSPYDYSSM